MKPRWRGQRHLPLRRRQMSRARDLWLACTTWSVAMAAGGRNVAMTAGGRSMAMTVKSRSLTPGISCCDVRGVWAMAHWPTGGAQPALGALVLMKHQALAATPLFSLFIFFGGGGGGGGPAIPISATPGNARGEGGAGRRASPRHVLDAPRRCLPGALSFCALWRAAMKPCDAGMVAAHLPGRPVSVREGMAPGSTKTGRGALAVAALAWSPGQAELFKQLH